MPYLATRTHLLAPYPDPTLPCLSAQDRNSWDYLPVATQLSALESTTLTTLRLATRVRDDCAVRLGGLPALADCYFSFNSSALQVDPVHASRLQSYPFKSATSLQGFIEQMYSHAVIARLRISILSHSDFRHELCSGSESQVASTTQILVI